MNEHKNIITIEDEIKEFSDKPVKSSALFKKIKELEESGGGGMPKDYPYTGEVLFDGDVVYADDDGDLGHFESSAEQLLITIDGVTHTLTWYEGVEDWCNSDDTVEVGIGENYCWLWVDGLPDGTYAVTLREAGIDSNFENAVNEVAGGGDTPSSELPEYSASEAGKALFVDGNGDLEWNGVYPNDEGVGAGKPLVHSAWGVQWASNTQYNKVNISTNSSGVVNTKQLINIYGVYEADPKNFDEFKDRVGSPEKILGVYGTFGISATYHSGIIIGYTGGNDYMDFFIISYTGSEVNCYKYRWTKSTNMLSLEETRRLDNA